jgi:hypothetical protein
MNAIRLDRAVVRVVAAVGAVALLTLGGALPGGHDAVSSAERLSLRELLPPVIGRQPILSRESTSAADPRASAAEVRLRNRFGARFAGAWDVPIGDAGSQPTLAITGVVTAQDRLVAAGLVGGAVDVQAAATSLDDLERLKVSAIDRLIAAGVTEWLVGVNVPRNVLEVEVDPESVPPSAEPVVRALAAESRIIAQTSAIQLTSYPNPEWSGQRVFLEIGGGRNMACTTGFAIRNAFGVFQTTAAHCATGDRQPVRAAAGDSGVPGGVVSTISGFQSPGGGRGDFAAFSFPGAVGFVFGANRSVKGAGDPVWFEQGVCFRGATSAAEKCAGVSNVNFSVPPAVDGFGRTWSFNVFCIDHGAGTPARGGDSGAAMYRAQGTNEALARGILSLTSDSKTCGTPIQTVLSTYNAQIVVK